ncbi:MAG: hypothetical protein P8N76_17350 [Pirellulaceae bacterium]|nr:hypothetical protein [Pirellulaceae bacterium]
MNDTTFISPPHSWHDIVPTEQPLCLGPETPPSTRGKFAHQLTIEARVQPKTLGNGQNDLPMCDGRTDLFGNMNRGQQRPLLVARWACASRLAGEGDLCTFCDVYAAMKFVQINDVRLVVNPQHRLSNQVKPECSANL